MATLMAFGRVAPVMQGAARMLHTSTAAAERLTISTMNENMLKMKYAVRGEIVARAAQLERDLKQKKKLPFEQIIYCNIGNPQSVGQKPVTYVRQVLALVMAPFQLESPHVTKMYPADVIARAKAILASTHGMGAYSESQGVEIVRQEVAAFIEKRDKHPCSADSIFLTGGASEGVKVMLNMLIRRETDGILVPIPQYPLYSAGITQFGGTMLTYHLDESKAWGCSAKQIAAQVEDARKRGITPRGIAVINPGNPTGQVLEESSMREIVQLCEKEQLLLLADEVYQSNVYGRKPFVSFRKVAKDLNSKVMMASFHSVSKGMLGECGLRGGYMELLNFEKDVTEQVLKAVSVNLCSNLPGQLTVGLMVNPPKSGEPSYDLYKKEYDAIYASLKSKAEALVKVLNSLPGMSCNASEGAMYLFPRVMLPAKAVEEAKKKNVAPDFLYCLELLNETGICVVPGSGFGQADGTYHFRTTFLPTEDLIAKSVTLLTAFQKKFMAKYA